MGVSVGFVFVGVGVAVGLSVGVAVGHTHWQAITPGWHEHAGSSHTPCAEQPAGFSAKPHGTGVIVGVAVMPVTVGVSVGVGVGESVGVGVGLSVGVGVAPPPSSSSIVYSRSPVPSVVPLVSTKSVMHAFAGTAAVTLVHEHERPPPASTVHSVTSVVPAVIASSQFCPDVSADV